MIICGCVWLICVFFVVFVLMMSVYVVLILVLCVCSCVMFVFVMFCFCDFLDIEILNIDMNDVEVFFM